MLRVSRLNIDCQLINLQVLIFLCLCGQSKYILTAALKYMHMDPELLLQLIRNNLQGSDNNLRKKAEHTLISLYEHNADELANTYLDILAIHNQQNQSSISNQTNYMKEIKRFVIVQLKNCLARKPRPPYHNIWPDLAQQTHHRIKKEFFTLLFTETDPSVMKILTGTIGRLAANLIVENDSAWPEFRQNLLEVFVNGSEVGVECGFYILESFFEEQHKHFKDIMPELYHLFDTSFQLTTTLDLKTSALKCFNSFLLVLDHSDHSKYQPLVPLLVHSVTELRLQHKDNTGLKILSLMLESEPKFFKPYFQILMDTFVTLYQSPELFESEKKMLTQTLVDYCDNYPSLFRSHVTALSHLIDMIVMHMLSVPKEITDRWLIPEQGFDQEYSDENEIDTTNYGLDCINSVIKAVGSRDALKHVQAVVEKLGSVQNWRYHYTAIMIMGQLGEYLSGLDKIQPYLITVFNALDSDNPMLRYAGCHAIGIFSEDLKPKFQQKYGIEVFNKMTELLYRQPAPRVVSHIQGALVNFLQGITFDLILPHFHKLSATLLDNCQMGISLVKQSALNAITSLVQIARSRFEPYIQYLFNLFKEFYTSNHYQDSSYNNLRGLVLETLSYVAVEVSKDSFLPFLGQLIQFLIKIPNSQDRYQPQARFIINAWQRLSIFYALEVDINIDRFFPDILETITSAITDVISSEEYEESEEASDQEDENQQGKGGKSYRMRLVEDGVIMLGTFSQNLPSLSSKYLHQTLQIYSNLLRNYPIQDTKELVSKNIPKTLQSIRNHNIREQTSKNIISDLILSFESYRSSLSSEYKLIAIHKILTELNYPLFTFQQLHILTEKLFFQLEESERQKQNLIKQSQGLDEDQIENAEGEMENQEDIQFNIIQIFGDIFKIYQTNALYLAKKVLNSILIDVWIHSDRQTSLKSALFLIDDIVEHIGYEYMQSQWPSFEQILNCHVIHPKCAVRQAASYGLGILAQKTPISLRNQETAINWLQKLNEALAIDKQKRDKLASYLYARDNIVAAIGKIMRVHIEIVNIEPYLPFWLIYLPIKKDKLQTYEQTSFLVQLVLDHPRVILKQESIDLLVRLITIFGETIKYELFKQDIADRLYQCIESLVMREFFQKNMDKIMENIHESLRNELFEFFRKTTQ